jgi:hypothetical protein
LVAASFVYSLRTFPTPFNDSLTAHQREIKRASAGARSKFFGCAFAVSLLVIGMITYRLS